MSTEQTLYHSFRVDAFYLLSHLKVKDKAKQVPDKLLDLAGGSDDLGVRNLFNAKSSSKAKKLSSDTAETKQSKHAASFSDQVISSARDVVDHLTAMYSDEASKKAKQIIRKQAKSIVRLLLSSVYDQLALDGDILKILKNLGRTAKNTCLYFNTRNLHEGITAGYARDTIVSVRGLLGKAMFEGFGTLLADSLKTGINSSVIGVGSVVTRVINAVKGALSFVVRTFMHIREVTLVNDVVTAARAKWDSKEHERSSFDDWFVRWYAKVVIDSPILACYVLGSNMGGSMYAFLNMKDEKTGEKLSQTEMKKYYDQYQSLRSFAREVAVGHQLKLSSDETLVKDCIRTVLKKNEKLTVITIEGVAIKKKNRWCWW